MVSASAAVASFFGSSAECVGETTRGKAGLMEMPHLWESSKRGDFHDLLGKAAPKNGGAFPHSHRPCYSISLISEP